MCFTLTSVVPRPFLFGKGPATICSRMRRIFRKTSVKYSVYIGSNSPENIYQASCWAKNMANVHIRCALLGRMLTSSAAYHRRLCRSIFLKFVVKTSHVSSVTTVNRKHFARLLSAHYTRSPIYNYYLASFPCGPVFVGGGKTAAHPQKVGDTGYLWILSTYSPHGAFVYFSRLPVH